MQTALHLPAELLKTCLSLCSLTELYRNVSYKYRVICGIALFNKSFKVYRKTLILAKLKVLPEKTEEVPNFRQNIYVLGPLAVLFFRKMSGL